MAKIITILDNSGHYPNEKYLMEEADVMRLRQIAEQYGYLHAGEYQAVEIKAEVAAIKARSEPAPKILTIPNYV